MSVAAGLSQQLWTSGSIAGDAQVEMDFYGDQERIDRAHREGELVIRIDDVRREPWGDERYIHVISLRAGGEIRGYRLCTDRGCAHVRLPAYEGHWPEIDALVARVVGCKVIGLDEGGVYTGETLHPTARSRR